jgi:hypothetical protein
MKFIFNANEWSLPVNGIALRGKDANGNSGAAVRAFLCFVGAFQDPTKYKKSRNRQLILQWAA